MARHDDPDEAFERIHKRIARPKGVRSMIELAVSADEARRFEEERRELAPAFKDADLQDLHERGLLDELLAPIRRGKEAAVYHARIGERDVAVKLYTDAAARSFRNDASYREGRFIGDTRIQRAIENHSRRGNAASQAIWVEEEYRQLIELKSAGVNVPTAIAHAGMAIVMELIGDEGVAAPRLSDAQLTSEEASSAYDQAVANLVAIVRSGRVHGDYSTFNLLWWRSTVVVIDLPQVVEIERNPRAIELLQRDVASLCASFTKHGIDADAQALERTLLDEVPADLHPENRALSVHAEARTRRS